MTPHPLMPACWIWFLAGLSLIYSFITGFIEMFYSCCEASLCRTSPFVVLLPARAHGVTHNWAMSSLWGDCTATSEKERYGEDLSLLSLRALEHPRINSRRRKRVSLWFPLRKRNVTQPSGILIEIFLLDGVVPLPNDDSFGVAISLSRPPLSRTVQVAGNKL